VIEFGLIAAEAGLDVAQAFAIGELSEGHAEELIPAGKGFDFVVALVAFDALAEFVGGEKLQELRENGFVGVHEPSPSLR